MMTEIEDRELGTQLGLIFHVPDCVNTGGMYQALLGMIWRDRNEGNISSIKKHLEYLKSKNFIIHKATQEALNCIAKYESKQ